MCHSYCSKMAIALSPGILSQKTPTCWPSDFVTFRVPILNISSSHTCNERLIFELIKPLVSRTLRNRQYDTQNVTAVVVSKFLTYAITLIMRMYRTKLRFSHPVSFLFPKRWLGNTVLHNSSSYAVSFEIGLQ